MDPDTYRQDPERVALLGERGQGPCRHEDRDPDGHLQSGHQAGGLSGQGPRPINVAWQAGWAECDEDWEAAGWKTCPIPESKTFGVHGNWLPIRVRRVSFEMPEIALRERLEGKLYRRNPVVISDRAFAKVQEAAL